MSVTSLGTPWVWDQLEERPCAPLFSVHPVSSAAMLGLHLQMKPLLGKQVVAGAWGREDTLETSPLPSEKGDTALTLQTSSRTTGTQHPPTPTADPSQTL